jgi:ribose transport system permease protein
MSELADPQAPSPVPERVAARGKPPAAYSFLGRFGVLIAFGVTFVVFAAINPDTFLHGRNLTDMLTQSAPLAMIAAGLTVILVMHDFDLSVGAMAGLAGAITAVLMSLHDVAWPLTIVVALAAGVAAGVANGVLVAYAGASSLIITLGLSTILTGSEFVITGQQTIFDGIPQGYVELGQGELLGVNYQVIAAALVLLATYLLLNQSEAGRYMHAVGGNPVAAKLSGVPVQRLRLAGFIIAATCSAVAGVLLTAQAASSSPNAGLPLLLPSYAAVFLGSAAFKPGHINVPGTVLGVLFLGVIQNGLTLMNASVAIVNVVQGVILVVAVLLTRLGRAGREA